MGFGQEMRDFTSSFSTVYKLGTEADEARARKAYYEKMGQKVDDKAAGTYDPDAARAGLTNADGSPTDLGDTSDNGALGTAKLAPAVAPAVQPASTIAPAATGAVAPVAGAPQVQAPQMGDQYARGGLVTKRYADGGAVTPDDQDVTQAGNAAPPAPALNTTPQPTTPAPQADQMNSSLSTGNNNIPASALPVSNAPSANQPAPPDDGRDGLASALHGGVMWLQKTLGLQQAVPGQGGVNPQGKAALLSGYGAASPQDYSGAAAAVDPKGKLSEAALNIQVLQKGYEFYLMHGNIEAANRYAASAVQYAIGQSSQFGQDALKALNDGDIKGAATYLQHGYNSLPNGKAATDPKFNKDGTVTVTQTDARTGKTDATHTLKPEDLYGAALGLANRSAGWQAILAAAGTVKGAAVPMTDAESAAIDAASTVPGQTASPGGGAPAAGGGGSPSTAAPSSLPATVDPRVRDAYATIPSQLQPLAIALGHGESRFNAGAMSPTSKITGKPVSVGLFQFTVPTWKAMTGQDIPPAVQGTAQDPRMDPKASAAAWTKLVQTNFGIFQKSMGRVPTLGENALMLQQGAGAATALLKAPPGTSAVDALTPIYGGNKGRAIAALIQNNIPANSTASAAVARVENYYGLNGNQVAPGTVPVGAPGTPQPGTGTPLERSMSVQPTRPEDASDEPTPPSTPNFPTPNVSAEAALPADQRRSVALARAQNIGILQKNYADAMTAYKANLAAWKANGGAGPKPLSADATDRADKDITKMVTPGDPDDKGNSTPAPVESVVPSWSTMSPNARSAFQDLALDIASKNSIPVRKALQHAGIMLGVDKPGAKPNFAIHQMPSGDTYRVVAGDGESFVIGKEQLGEIAMARGENLYHSRVNAGQLKPSDPEFAAAADQVGDRVAASQRAQRVIQGVRRLAKGVLDTGADVARTAGQAGVLPGQPGAFTGQ